MKPLACLLLIATFSSTTYAANQQKSSTLDASQIYFGGGVTLNDIDRGDDAVGFQVFAGLPLPVDMGKAKLAAEVGYMDSGDFDVSLGPLGTASESANGLWANAVVDVPLQDGFGVIGRLGLDFGDDDGVMIGGGIGLRVNSKLDVRFEYVIRDNIDSLQANIVIRQ